MSGGDGISNGDFVSGSRTVTTAGTAVRLVDPGAWCTDLWITAAPGNTQPVLIGGPDVEGPVSGRKGLVVPNAGQTPLHLCVDDPSKIFVDAQVSGEGVLFTYKEP